MLVRSFRALSCVGVCPPFSVVVRRVRPRLRGIRTRNTLSDETQDAIFFFCFLEPDECVANFPFTEPLFWSSQWWGKKASRPTTPALALTPVCNALDAETTRVTFVQ